MMHHDPETLADYALGLLEKPEMVTLEEHLVGCQQCHAEVTRLRATLSMLAEELEPVAPPLGSFDRVKRRIQTKRNLRFAPRWILPFAAAILAVSTSIFGLLWSRNQAALREVNTTQATLSTWLARSDVRFIPLQNRIGQTLGRVLVSPDGHALIVMPKAAPKGLTYQAWGLFEHSRTAPAESLGVSNQAVFAVENVKPYPWFWLSLEPNGGSIVPTKGVGWSKVD
jgi:anti-sigma-K factor RskA